VAKLETLEAIASLSFLADNIQNGINEFRTLGVVSLSPVVSCSGLTEDEVVRAEELSEWSSTNAVHCSGLEIHQNRTGNITSSSCLIEIYVDALQLKIAVTMIGTGGVDAMLIGDDFPKLSSNLVAALTGLDVYQFAHDEVGGLSKDKA
jgi:hypothetical protein